MMLWIRVLGSSSRKCVQLLRTGYPIHKQIQPWTLQKKEDCINNLMKNAWDSNCSLSPTTIKWKWLTGSQPYKTLHCVKKMSRQDTSVQSTAQRCCVEVTIRTTTSNKHPMLANIFGLPSKSARKLWPRREKCTQKSPDKVGWATKRNRCLGTKRSRFLPHHEGSHPTHVIASMYSTCLPFIDKRYKYGRFGRLLGCENMHRSLGKAPYWAPWLNGIRIPTWCSWIPM